MKSFFRRDTPPSGYVADPWRFDYRIVGGEVLVIGSGLTALDVLVALKAVRPSRPGARSLPPWPLSAKCTPT